MEFLPCKIRNKNVGKKISKLLVESPLALQKRKTTKSIAYLIFNKSELIIPLNYKNVSWSVGMRGIIEG